MKLLVATLMWAIFVSPAHACKPGDLEHIMEFSPGQSTLDKSQIFRFIEWYKFNRAGLDYTQGIETLYLFAGAIRGSGTSRRLASQRTANLVRLLRIGDAHTEPIEIVISEKDLREPSTVVTIDTVIAAVQPICATTHSCCP
jgi:hypothetical protein